MAVESDMTVGFGTQLTHADATQNSTPDVSPPISVTTTFRRPLCPTEELDPVDPQSHVYARYSQDITSKGQKILSKINGGHALTYASGLAAAYAALVHYQPNCIAIRDGYFGCHNTINVFKKSRNAKIVDIDDDFEEGTLCWLETPLNPTGESRNIQHYADKVHAVNGHLLVDSTFAPPPLQYPFKWGADSVLHSGSKYLGGHSDLLCGVLVVKSHEEAKQLFEDRTFMGNVMGSLESWLLLRSLRTLHLRVPRQSQTATKLAAWLDQISLIPFGQELDGVPGGLIFKVYHSSLQARTASWDVAKQMEGGWNATFSIKMAKSEDAARLPHFMDIFIAATSLGGVESLMEHRASANPSEDPRIVRLSIGVEDLEDLKLDLKNALIKLGKEEGN